jgi:hypothetical protein
LKGEAQMIKDLPINTNGKLNGDAKKQLALIIEQEFHNKTSLYSVAIELEKEKIIEAYRKKMGFDTLKKSLKKAEDNEDLAKKKIEDAKLAIKKLGLTEDGTLGNIHESIYYRGEHITIRNDDAIELRKKIDALEKNAPSQSFKSKLISRIWLATTIGEANEIMREVLGNGIIQATDVKSITFQD